MIKRKVRSIKARLLIPLTLIICLQMLSLVLFYQYGGVMSTLHSNAVRIFSETTKHTQLNMEQELMQHWMNSIRDTEDIPETIEQILKENGCTAEDIATNPEMNSKIMSELTERMIDLLHYSFGNGIYLVLDGPASVNGDPEEQAGLFIRDLDASTYEQNRSDLLLERGLPSIAREYGIPLDSFWELGVNLDKIKTKDFYTKPFECAVKGSVQQRNASGCAYLGIMKSDEQKKTTNLSYSMPLILSDGTIIGVIGGEIDAGRIRQFLEDDLDKIGGDVLSFLARSSGDNQSFIPVIAGNTYYGQYFEDVKEISYKDSEWDSVGIVKDQEGNTCYAAIEPLEIYSGNTPFEKESWMIVRIQQEKSLFANSNEVRRTLIISVTGSLVLSLIMLFLASHVITSPIRRLMGEIRRVNLNRRPYLKKIQIQEIDELVDEVNRLSTGVAEHASKISQILDALDIETGVFEYEPGADKVFCSHSLLKLLGVSCDDGMYQFMDKSIFEEKVSMFQNPMEDESGKIYEFQDGTQIRYIRIKIMETEKKEMTGVLMDVTAEVNERRRLEKERDCDLLTGLYNRGGFQKKVMSLLGDEEVSLGAFVMWDMDNLKYVNDTYGHEAGDSYIRMFAKHLQSLEEEGAVVGRRSGDEFMAVLYNGNEQELWDRIRKSMDQLKHIMLGMEDGSQIPLRASAGVAWYPRHSAEFDELIRYADFAMYMSKHSYKGIVQEFDAETYQTNSYLLSGREELNQILESGDVKFALQPIVTRTGQIYGYEVLMRPVLKKLKNISELLHLTKIQAKLPQFEELTWFGALEWVSARESNLAQGAKIFINSIANVSLTSEVIRRLEADFGGMLNRIVLELTETEEADKECLESKISTIRKWGSLLALDDYGAGYSNDATLLQIEPNLVKMDLALVRDIHLNKNQQVIATHLIDYCHSRDIMVVAEGVETEEELKFLMRMQVDLFQGYYIARPNIEIQSSLEEEVVQKMRRLTENIWN